jgi:hypothetical protein
MFSLEAISLFSRLQITECRICCWRGLNCVVFDAERPWASSSSARAIRRWASTRSTGTRIAKSPGSVPRAIHCIAKSPAARSIAKLRLPSEAAPNCATPVALSQKINEFGLFASRVFTVCSGNAGLLFTFCLPLASPGTGAGKVFNFCILPANAVMLGRVVLPLNEAKPDARRMSPPMADNHTNTARFQNETSCTQDAATLPNFVTFVTPPR